MQAAGNMDEFRVQRKVDQKEVERLRGAVFARFRWKVSKPFNKDLGINSFLDDLCFAAARDADTDPVALLKDLREGLGAGEFNDWDGKDPFFDEAADTILELIRTCQGMEKQLQTFENGLDKGTSEELRQDDRIFAIMSEVEGLRDVAVMVEGLKASLTPEDREILEKSVPALGVQRAVNRIHRLLEEIHKPLRTAAEAAEEPLRTFSRGLLDDPRWRGIK